MKQRTWLWIALMGIGLVAGMLWMSDSTPPIPPSQVSQPVEPAPAAPLPVEASPVIPLAPSGLEGSALLPLLAESDGALIDELVGWFGRATWEALFHSDRLIRRSVATIDNLPRREAPVGMWPLKRAKGWLVTETQAAGTVVLAARNARRYDLYMNLLAHAEPVKLAALYRKYHPLFQQAYEELGFPGRSFDDRLHTALDDLLATPEPASSLNLVQEHVLYRFADSELERLSAGQKILLRMGPAHARAVKAWLIALRKALTDERHIVKVEERRAPR